MWPNYVPMPVSKALIQLWISDSFTKNVLDRMATCNSDCALSLTLPGNPSDITYFLSLFDVP